ncbi:DUF3558 family protein [Nocardia carnea]|uniref:DUF3558 family protein n=1 Tax=Nocardia carnea TaxID=37328 RepID=UPI002457942F|nr:DUF3558 family protein [Nocardia carnea]
MRNAVRAMCRGIGVAVAVSAVVLTTAGCETNRAAPETVVVEVPGPGMPPPTAPWTTAQLTYHPCVVLAETDLSRFGFESPGDASTPPQGTHCLWRGRDGAGRRQTLSFVPDHDGDYAPYERVFREKNPDATRTLTLADRPAFVFFDGSGDPLGCTVYAAVESGGQFRLSVDYESGARIAAQDCDPLVEVAGLVAGRMR